MTNLTPYDRIERLPNGLKAYVFMNAVFINAGPDLEAEPYVERMKQLGYDVQVDEIGEVTHIRKISAFWVRPMEEMPKKLWDESEIIGEPDVGLRESSLIRAAHYDRYPPLAASRMN